MRTRHVLIGGTEAVALHHVQTQLSAWGYQPVAGTTVDACLSELAQKQFVFCLLDLSLDVTEPAHAQSNDAIRDLVDVLGSVFFQCFGRFHFEHDDLNLIATAASLSQPERKAPAGLGGLSWGF